jgi:hypothetical protein
MPSAGIVLQQHMPPSEQSRQPRGLPNARRLIGSDLRLVVRHLQWTRGDTMLDLPHWAFPRERVMQSMQHLPGRSTANRSVHGDDEHRLRQQQHGERDWFMRSRKSLHDGYLYRWHVLYRADRPAVQRQRLPRKSNVLDGSLPVPRRARATLRRR